MADLNHTNQNFSSSFLSIVFSFYNEEDVLPELIQRTRAALTQLQSQGNIVGYELIFVNDASNDNSLRVLLDCTHGHDDIRIMNMSRRFGVSPCVMAGLAYTKGDLVVYMDADLQDPPEVIPGIIEKMRQTDADVVHTVRESRKGESAFKLFLTRLGYAILNKTSSVQLPVEAGDFKLLSRRVVDHILQLKEHRPFMRGLVCWVGFKQEFVPYHRAPRYAGQAKFFILGKDVINNFFSSALISFSSAPLRMAYIVGLWALFFDFILFCHVMFEKLSGRAVPGWTAIMMAILFLGAIQLLCMGILGLYMYSIYEQTRARPNYIVESMYGFTNTDDKDQQLDLKLKRKNIS